MPIDLKRPRYTTQGALSFGVHFADAVFEIRSSDFKYALDLKPYAKSDEKKALDIARNNWPVLELIAREALDSGRVTLKPGQKPRATIHYVIDFETFCELLERHEKQIVR